MNSKSNYIKYFQANFYYYFVIALLFISCTTNEQKKVVLPLHNQNNTDIPKIKTPNDKTTEYAAKIDSLLRYFCFKRKDFPFRTYYHKNWWCIYTIRDHALTAGVDSMGNLILTACSYVGLLEEIPFYNNTEIKIIINDSTFSTNRKNEISKSYFLKEGLIERSVAPGTWSPVTSVFMNGKENGVIKEIAKNHDKRIRFYFERNRSRISPIFTLSKRDKKGIKDCYELSQLLKMNNRK